MTPEDRKTFVHKFCALALLGVAILAVASIVVAPLAQATIEARDEVASARERLAALKARRLDLAALEAALKDETARSVDRPLLIEAASSADGWRKMEAQLRSIAAARDGEVTSVRPARLEDDGALKALRLDVTLRTPPERLAELLAAVEAAAPMLFVERLRATAGQGSDDDRLDLSLTLRGLAAIGAPQPHAARPGARR
ncbi:MAG: hypothetical protein DI565_16975 [Ancylobacter novellus]|uniref:General secretion pathway protein GspM n=1 Tax=Ancylobacter novellus TaxID=921 RepID=A0A2W5K9Z7_ANCNO|nr:MAG: hypothetical protein DI565_16975 [Ancylobacter novellus]